MSLRHSLGMKPLLIALVSIFALASCSEDIGVTVEKNNSETIFRFGMRGMFSNDFKPICLRMIEVRKEKAEEKVWKIVRRRDKCALINSFVLGQSMPGFVEQINSLPLDQDRDYVVSIIADEGSVTSDAWRQ